MKLKQVPLVFALALAIGALTAGCAQDNAPENQPAADAGAVAEATHVDAHAETHVADHADAVAHASGVDFPVPENHVQWTPDAPLMEGMSRVRTAIGVLEGQPDPETVAAAAADIDTAVDYMFANCELDTEPDIALHAILARLMAGTRALEANPGDAAPVADMHAAVENYERLFDDPNSVAVGL